MDSKTIEIKYSEEVDQTTATDIAANYKIYSAGASKLYNFSTASSGADVQASAQLQADNKTVLIKIVDASDEGTPDTDLPGFVLDGLNNSDYILYASNVKDKAAAPNTIVENSNVQFTGTTGVDTTAPTLLTSKYDNGLKKLTLSFDEPTTVVDPSLIQIVNGSKTVTLNGAAPASSQLDASITLTADQATELGQLQPDAKVVVKAGAVKDASNNLTTADAEKTLSQIVRPELASASYDEATNKLALSFNTPIKTSNVYTSKFDVQWSTDGFTTVGGTLATLNDADYTFEQAGASAQTISFKLDQAAIDLLGAKRDTDNVTYRVVVTDGAVTDATGTYANDTGAAGGTDTANAALSYTKETVAPQVTGAKFYTTADTDNNIASKALYITFDQAVRPESITNDGKLVVDVAGTETSLTTVAGNVSAAAAVDTDIDPTGKTVKVVFTDGDEINAIKAGTAKVEIKDGSTISDVNGNKVAVQETTPTYNDNAAAGAITATQASSRQIKLAIATGGFDEATATNASNYKVYRTTNVNDVISIKSVDYVDTDGDGDKDTVFLTADSTTPILVNDTTGYTVEYTGLKDKNGVAIKDNKTTFVSLASDDSAAPTIVPAKTKLITDNGDSKVSQGDVVQLFYNEPVQLPAASDLQEEFGTGASVAYGADTNILNVTLGAAPTLTLGTGGTVIGVNGVKDIKGNDYTSESKVVALPDAAIAPKLTSVGFADANNNGIVDTDDTLTLKFDKAIDTTQTPNVGSITLETADGVSVNDPKLEVANKSGDTITLKFNGTPQNSGSDVLTLTEGQAQIDIEASSNIKNLWGQEVEALADDDTEVITFTTGTPTLQGITYDSAAHTLTYAFDKAVGLDSTLTTTGTGATAFIDATKDSDGLVYDGTASELNLVAASDNGETTVDESAVHYATDGTTTDYTKVVVTLDGTENIDSLVKFNAPAGDLFDGLIKSVNGKTPVRNASTYNITIK
ncbi:beta strand repeat-containing protein [Clostridium sp. LBM24168]